MTYTYSYSGADCRAYGWFDNKEDAVEDLFSLATISISIHEAKAPVRRLGHVAVSGYSKGIRTIAGTMVFLVIEDHPLRGMMNRDPVGKTNNYYYSEDSDKGIDQKYKTKLSTMISPFNILLKYQTETGFIEKETPVKFEDNPFSFIGPDNIAKIAKNKEFNISGASMLLKGVEITGESIVTSVNDMVTEVVIQFVAQDIHMLKKEEAINIVKKNQEVTKQPPIAPESNNTDQSINQEISLPEVAKVVESNKAGDSSNTQKTIAQSSTERSRAYKRNTDLKMPSTLYEKTPYIKENSEDFVLDQLLEKHKGS